MARLKPIWLDLASVAERVRSARHMFLATDFDGTLARLTDHPDRAGIPPRTRRVLRVLSHLPDVRVAVISGRGLENLRAMVRVPGLHLSGTVGLETEGPDGRRRDHARADSIPPTLRRDLEDWSARFEGAWLEDKRLAFTLHYRDVPESAQSRFTAGVRRRLAPYGDRVRLVHGKKVLEVMPPGTWDKASALARWARGGRHELLLYLGDDEHDEPVHRFVREKGGIAIAVGRERSSAEYALADDQEVTWWLEWLAGEWKETRRATVPRRPATAEEPR